MLVLTRKQGESVLIGDEIEVRVLSVNGDKVRVGISAPRHLEIFRNELLEARRANPSTRPGPRT